MTEIAADERDRRLRALGVDPSLVVDERDAEYMAGVPAGAQRQAVVCTLTDYRYPDTLRRGDRPPNLELHPLEGGDPVRLSQLPAGAPVVLFFGSYT